MNIYQTRSGPMMVLDSDIYVGRSIALYGEYCPGEWQMLQAAIRPGATVVEVGANMGTHSVAMAKTCAPGPFYAFEPQPRLFQILCGNLALNDIANAFAYPEACGEAEGELLVPRINYDKTGNFGALSLGQQWEEGVRVRVRTLDSLGLERCDLIKIDVEGFELQVIRGATETIRRCRPILYVENDRADQQQALISGIGALGFDLYWHAPRLFDPGNFRGNSENVFGGIGSVNMLCIPQGTPATVNLEKIDPANWRSPVKLMG